MTDTIIAVVLAGVAVLVWAVAIAGVFVVVGAIKGFPDD